MPASPKATNIKAWGGVSEANETLGFVFSTESVAESD